MILLTGFNVWLSLKLSSRRRDWSFDRRSFFLGWVPPLLLMELSSSPSSFLYLSVYAQFFCSWLIDTAQGKFVTILLLLICDYMVDHWISKSIRFSLFLILPLSNFLWMYLLFIFSIRFPISFVSLFSFSIDVWHVSLCLYFYFDQVHLWCDEFLL